MFKGKGLLTKGKHVEYVFLGIGMILIITLFIVLYQVNSNGKNKAIIVQNSLEGANDEGNSGLGRNNSENNNKDNNNQDNNNQKNSNQDNNNNQDNSYTDINSSEKNDTGNIGTSLIDLNTASLEELQTLKGIGPSKAQAIIDYRNTERKFQHISDITNVSGIGEKTFEKIKEYITVGKD